MKENFTARLGYDCGREVVVTEMAAHDVLLLHEASSSSTLR